ncbi:DUF2284 domain-containing protein [Parasporobacterium paucivorans]|uniref:Predicted metal-binding protein n=1 Tax=Parasporobacterium paucivorans DSM 15970 TaxID=1122934 RepID=A0A1M6GAC8_9FIRM|nr:DUF2284 domain-containing protein [Parasporobacterium paucivorans]SHJ06913.1 Predicted metal-binding protein [Parasporobacterium paucivorans DSM 15970]
MSIDLNMVIIEAKEAGFTEAAILDPETINLMPEVRDMCSANTCGQYDKNWSCPPGCGTLEECRENVSGFKRGIIVQTVGELEDEWDFEGMVEIEKGHKKVFMKFADELRTKYGKILCLGDGPCAVCEECTFPEKPCRLPEKKVSAMEAYGILVSDVCKKNGLGYYFGRCKVAFISCYLFE